MIQRSARAAAYVVRNVLLALVCLPIARLGLIFAFENGNVSLVWPLTGIALAALLLWGRKYWPGLWLVVFVSNLISQTAPLVCFGIACGSTATALVAAYVLQERVDFRASLARVGDVLNFAAAGVILTPLISATVGVGSLYLAGQIPAQNVALDWFTWWVGDAMGVLVVAPVLLIWGKIPFRLPSRFRMIEAEGLLILLMVTCWLVFRQGFEPSSFYPLAYLIFPFLIWGALRFDQRMVVTLTLIVSLIAVVQTGVQLDSFSRDVTWNGLLFLWAYLATMAITSMLLTATLAEGHETETARLQAEARYRQLFEGIDDAIFVHDLDANILDVNEATCRRLGYTRDELLHMKVTDLDAPEFAAGFKERLRQQLAKGYLSQIEGSQISKDGREIFIDVNSKLISYKGQTAVLAVDRDITERKRTEAMFSGLLEAAPDAMVIVNQRGEIVLVNAQTERLFGYSAEELVGQSVDMLVPEHFRGKHFGHRAAYFAETVPRPMGAGMELYALRKDGSQFPVEISLSPMETEQGVLVSSAIRDISEHKQAEQRLRASETRYRAIVEDQTEMICRLSPQWEINFVNDAYCRYYGKTREELVGSTFRPLIYEEDYPAVEAAVNGLTPENPVAISEHRVIMADGSLRWHQLTDRAIYDEGGQVIEYQFVGKDITDAKEMEQQRLAVALEREKVQILADFIAAASHDFRTPLSVINTSAYLLNRVIDTEQRDHHFRQIQEQTYHIERLVDGLLTMSRLDRGDVFRFKAVNLNSVIRQIEVRKRPEIEDKRQTLTLDLDADLPQVEADEGWIYRCIVQLVDNAIHYTPEGGTITLGTAQQAGRVIVTVGDTGVGIAADVLPHIFKRLYRAERHRPVGGQGLGLSIAAKIVEAHQGSIEVESAPGMGSTFRIVLPLKRALADTSTNGTTGMDTYPATGTDSSRPPSPIP